MTDVMDDISGTKLFQAGDILSTYVGYGAMAKDGMFDADFAKLKDLLPEGCRRAPKRAFRVLAVPDSDYKLVQDGGTLRLRPRVYGSWTKDMHAARRFLRKLVGSAPVGQMVITIRKTVGPGDVVADVEAVYKALGWNCDGMDCWFRYASWERELILRQKEHHLIIDRTDVVAAHQPRDLSVMGPLVGERAWDEAADAEVVVKSVAKEQPEAEQGVWSVAVAGQDFIRITWNYRVDAWDTVTPDFDCVL